MKPRIAYLIFVRPPGSQMWTQHMRRGKGIPFISYRSADANGEAVGILYAMPHYCARVVPVELPREVDEQLHAILSDGDTRYCAVL